ncbi:hypothetical protein KM043_017637 [Ampulex compressa]|nr:hypothetical protein KM043_017637 [Ampulex compressa]
MLTSILITNVCRSTARLQSFYGKLQKYLVPKDMLYASLSASYSHVFGTKIIRLYDGKSQMLLMSRKSQWNLLIQQQQTNAIDVNTNIKNNVILFKHDRPASFRNLRIFAILQLFCWSVIAYYSYTKSFSSIFNTDISLKEYSNKYALRLLLFMAAVITAPATCALIWYLHKDVKQIQPVKKIYSRTSRIDAKDGNFINEQLFDHTVGLKKNM